MPYDAKALEALTALSPAIDAYQARVTAVADRIKEYLDTNGDDTEAAHEGARLGEFAAGRIDLDRFAALWEPADALDHSERRIVARARDVLRDIATWEKEQFIVNVPPGGRIAAALGNFLSDIGRGLGAMTVAELVRTRRFDDDDLDLFHGFPRFRWTRAERGLSPPVIVTLDGADLWAGEAAQYLDGNQKVVLVVRSPAPPAPMVRLITPGTFVMQTCEVHALEMLLTTDGPAIAAVMPDGAAEFVHRPGATPSHQRIVLTTRPQGARRGVEGWTTWQQQQELEQLYALAAAPPAAAQPTSDATTADPAARLASWLLSHADAASDAGDIRGAAARSVVIPGAASDLRS